MGLKRSGKDPSWVDFSAAVIEFRDQKQLRVYEGFTGLIMPEVVESIQTREAVQQEHAA